MKKYLYFILVGSLIAPSFVMAAWWNPFSWKIFSKPAKTATSTAEIIQKQATSTLKISEKKQVLEVKKVKNTTISNEVDQKRSGLQTKQITLPNGSVIEIDNDGNFVRTIKEVPQSQSTEIQPDNKAVGENYYNSNKTCAGLKDVNTSQYSYCVSYGLKQNETSSSQSSQLQYGQTYMQVQPSNNTVSNQDNCKLKIDNLLLQIINIKKQYYEDVERAQNVFAPQFSIDASINDLTNTVNKKILSINFQIQELQLNPTLCN